MPSALAFFDTCTRHPDPTNTQFVMAKKVLSVQDRIEAVHRAAERLGAPILSTTCLGVQRGFPEISVSKTILKLNANASAPGGVEKPSDIGFISTDASQEQIDRALRCRSILIERRSACSPEENMRLRTFDPFGVNPNTARVVRALADRRWIVFGSGFEGCVLAVVEGLRNLKKEVTVLEDACIPSLRSTPATFQQTIERIKSLGAEWRSFASVMEDAALWL